MHRGCASAVNMSNVCSLFHLRADTAVHDHPGRRQALQACTTWLRAAAMLHLPGGLEARASAIACWLRNYC